MPIKTLTTWKRKQRTVEERIRKLEHIQEETRQWRRAISAKRKDLLWKRKDYQRFQEKNHQKITTVVKDAAWKLDHAKQERRAIQQKVKEIKRQQTMLLPFVVVIALVLMIGLGSVFLDFSNGITGLVITDIGLGIGDETIIVNDTAPDTIPEGEIAIDPIIGEPQIDEPTIINETLPEGVPEEKEEQPTLLIPEIIPPVNVSMGLFNDPIDAVSTPVKPLFVQDIKTMEEVIQETGIRVDKEKVASIIQPTYSSVEIDFKEGIYTKGLIIHPPLVNGQIVTTAIPLVDKDQYTYSATFEDTTMDIAFEQNGIGIAIGNFTKFSESNSESWKIGYKYPLPADVFTARLRVSSSSPIEITNPATATLGSDKFILDFSTEWQNGYTINTLQAAPQVVYVYLTKNFTAEGKAVNDEIIVDPTLTISNTITELCGTITQYDLIEVINKGKLRVCSQNITSETGYVNISLGYFGNFTVRTASVVEGFGAKGGEQCAASGCISFTGNNGDIKGLNGSATTQRANGGGGTGNDRILAANSGAGGGGGFGGAGGAGGNSSVHTNKSSGGLTYGSPYNETLVMGSGGGGNSGDGTALLGSGGSGPGGGGAGGGGIKIVAGAGGMINIHGVINMSGQNGSQGDPADDSAGGGGSGGHIILKAGYINISSSIISAAGGQGGNGSVVAGADSCPGGGGGGGRILFISEMMENSSNFTSYSIKSYGGERGTGGDAECDTEADPVGNATGGQNGTLVWNSTAFDRLPTIRLIAPANSTTNTSDATPEFIFNISDDLVNLTTQSFLNCTLWLSNATLTTAYGTNNTVINRSKTIITVNSTLNNGPYQWYINCSDGYDSITEGGALRQNSSTQPNLTINVVAADATPPVVTLLFPTNRSTYNKIDYYNLNFSTDEIANITLNDTRWTLIAARDGVSFNFSNNTALADGGYDIKVYANDSAANNGSININFIKDTTGPVVTLNFPENRTTISRVDYYTINISTNEIANITLNDTRWTLNQVSNGVSFGFANNTVIGEGRQDIKVYANDTYNNNGSANIQFFKDVTAPTTTIVFPANASRVSRVDYYTINVSVNERANVTLNDTRWTFSQASSGTAFGFANNTALTEGNYDIKVYVNDSGNNNGSASFNFIKDTIIPQVTIAFPRQPWIYSARDLPLNFNITLSENGSVLYSINYSRNVSLTSSDEATAFGRFFNRSNDTMYDGNFTFLVYANDTAGNRNYTVNTTFEYDGTAPLITYADPTPADGSSQSASYIYLNATTNDTHDHYSFVELDEDVTLYMRMDQVNSSGDPQDTSGNARHGDLVSGAFINRSDIFGNASYYDGNGDNININGTTNSLAHFINGSRPFTISAWVKLSNTTNRAGSADEFPGVMRLETNQSTVFTVTFGRLGGYEGLNFGSQVGFIGRRTSENLTASFYSNQWFHIALAYDGGDIASGGSYTLYINGTAHPHVNNDGFGAPSRGSRIGIGDSDTISSFNGSIDEVIILKRNISATEAAALYNARAAQYRQNFTNLSQTAHTFRTQSVDILGNNASSDRTITITSAVAAPTITFVSNVSAQTITEASTVQINFSFTATDTNGAGDLNNATARLRVNLTGETDRTNSTCHALSIIGANTINYSCSVNIWYFDATGFWTINASISDAGGLYTENLSMAFFLQETTALRMSPGSITFPHVELGSTNLTSNNDPLVLNNTGNRDISVGGITFEGNDLQGVTTTTEFIRAANFSVWPRNGTNSCSGTSCFECNGTTFANNSFTPLGVANLSAGNNSINSQDTNSGQEELFLCLRAVAPEISRQSYSTSAGPLTDIWTVAIS